MHGHGPWMLVSTLKAQQLPEPQHSCLRFLLCVSLRPLSTWTLRIHFLCLKLKFVKRQHLIGLASHHEESISLPGRRPGWVLSRPAARMLMAASGSCTPPGATPAWPRGRHHSSAWRSVLQGLRWTRSAWDHGQGITRGPAGPSCSQPTGME